MNQAKILLIDDDHAIAASLEQVLASEGYQVTVQDRGDLGLARARAEVFDVVLTDLKMPGMGGLELVETLHRLQPRLPIILMTAHGTTETAIKATKLGAFDYLLKPFEMEELIALVAKSVATRRMSAPIELGETPTAREAIVGNSKAMQNIYKEVGRIASSSVSVLIRGETGTGKELIARAIYQHSNRAEHPFIAINCAAIPETLLESELFGHERGAFTGAETKRIGRFEQADKGTILLDEIGELSLSTQAKLLRVLQEKTIQRLGGKETISVDIRVIAATHRNLEKAIEENKFRQDLYYRLSAVVLTLPPLRQRKDDIPSLVNYFLRRHAAELDIASPSIHADALALLQDQPWRGNIRELENVVRVALVLARNFTIAVEHVRKALERGSTESAGERTLPEWVAEILERTKTEKTENAHAQVMAAVEKELFGQAIRLAKGNQAQAARLLGVSRITMREKLLQFHMHPAQEPTE